jgi:hypothetical protein
MAKETMVTSVTLGELARGGRFDPEYWDPEYIKVDKLLRRKGAHPMGDFISFITYGQVGKRVLSSRGAVRYLQVVNIRDTGIDFDIKPDRLTEGSYNDIPRSRVQKDDILFTRNSFGGMSRLLGRCVVVHRDLGKVNVSEDIDIVRVNDIDPYYVCTFIKCSFGQAQIQRLKYGVRSTKLSFHQVRQILVPDADGIAQSWVRRQYLQMAAEHDAAMERKARLLLGSARRGGRDRGLEDLVGEDRIYVEKITAAEGMLRRLLERLEAYVSGEIAVFGGPGRQK